MSDYKPKKLRPIDAFVKYFLDVKPYHTKLLEIVERYKFSEEMVVDIEDSLSTKIKYRNEPLCREVGWGVIYDQCGFSNDSCCDLFQCLGGYGLIWDNSDLTATHTSITVDSFMDEVIIDGDWTKDIRLEILQVETNSVLLRGDHVSKFDSQKLFLIAPFNVRTIKQSSGNTLRFDGDISTELLTKREFKLNGNDGTYALYGVSSATFDSVTNETILTVAGINDFTGVQGHIETEVQPKNQGFYPVQYAELDGSGNTRVVLRDGHAFKQYGTQDVGSVQLRTGLTSPRQIWLSGTDSDGNQVEREYRIADSYFVSATGKTHIVIAENLFVGDDYTTINTYGYVTSSGFDNNEECDKPKPTNIHAVIGEKLVIRIKTKTIIPPPILYFAAFIDDYELDSNGGGGY